MGLCGDAERVLLMLDELDNPACAAADDRKTLPKFIHGLVMGGAKGDLGASHNLSHQAFRRKRDIVHTSTDCVPVVAVTIKGMFL